jgi:uncharacterized protein (TIGR03086 family)
MAETNPLARFDRAAEAAGRVIAGVKPEQLDDPTPCTEWNVRQVINHIVGGTLFFVHALETGSFDRDSFDRSRDFLGDDPAAAFRDSVARLHERFAAPGALQQMVPTPFGVQPAAMLAEMRVTEMLVHGWDVAKATGQPTDLDPELAEERIEPFRAMRASGRGRGMFRDEQPVPDGATAADRLAALAGRTVS